MAEDAVILNSVAEKIIGCAYAVGKGLGTGFLEKVYENALVYELEKNGLSVVRQKPIEVYYDGVLVGEYFTDLIVDDEIIVELKATKAIDGSHLSQCIHYLKATQKRLCLLVNFGTPSVQIKRVVNGL